MTHFRQAVDSVPLFAILRGLPASHAEEVTEVLCKAGFKLIEVPLTSEESYDAISVAKKVSSGRAVVGAGTVINESQVERLIVAGIDFAVSPNCDVAVIQAGQRGGLTMMPGVCTPTEVFAAHAARAEAVKLFPLEVLGCAGVRALKTVMPRSMLTFGVGSVDEGNIAAFLAAGCSGLGLGGSLYKPGLTIAQVQINAARLMAAFLSARTLR